MATDVKRIAIIGAGLAGISALRRLSENKLFQLTCFERNFDIGGTWLYTDQTVKDSFGRPVTTAVYHNLTTVSPKQIMEIDGFPLNGSPTFPDHRQVLEYLHRVADECDIKKFIKFNTEVKAVKPIDSTSRDTKWTVTYGDIRYQNEDRTEEFDAVVVCNGNCSTPKYPEVENQELYRGSLIHSMWYRRPENYHGMNVAVLGARFSGVDIAFELSKQANKVYLCHTWSVKTELPENVIEKKSKLKRLTETSVILSDGEELPVDAVIYCTGYEYNFKFLPDCLFKIGNNNNVCNLYKFIIPEQWLTLLFIGIPRQVSFFKMGDHQALFVRAVLEGTAKLPSQEKMREVIEHDAKYLTITCSNQWEWDKELAEIANNFEPYPPVMKKLWDFHYDTWRKDFKLCKTLNYEVTGHDSFRLI